MSEGTEVPQARGATDLLHEGVVYEVRRMAVKP
jgi:hypothetical protein